MKQNPEIIQEAVDLYEQGKSYNYISKYINDKYSATTGRGTIRYWVNPIAKETIKTSNLDNYNAKTADPESKQQLLDKRKKTKKAYDRSEYIKQYRLNNPNKFGKKKKKESSNTSSISVKTPKPPKPKSPKSPKVHIPIVPIKRIPCQFWHLHPQYENDIAANQLIEEHCITDLSHEPLVQEWLSWYPFVYTNEQLKNEAENIKDRKGTLQTLPNYNKNILHFQPHFFHVEMDLLKSWVILNKLYDNRQKHCNYNTLTKRELLRGIKISGIHQGYSHFSSLWAKYFIENTQCQSVYDPTGGWGHRLLGISPHVKQYIYNDLWGKTVNGIKQMVQLHEYDNVVIYQNDAAQFIPQEEYDAVFTCPPYNNIEIYGTGSFESLETYLNFIKQMVVNACKPSVKHLGIVIGNQFADDFKRVIPFELLNIEGIRKNKGHYNHTSFEVLMTFNPQRIKVDQ